MVQKHRDNHKEIIRLLKAELTFTSDIMRDSCETVKVRNVILDSMKEEEKDRSPLDVIDYADYRRNSPLRAQSTLLSTHYLQHKHSDSNLDTVHLSF